MMTSAVPQTVKAGASTFSEELLNWWKTHKRDFPWRQEKDPYLVLVGELMLRRTHARQVVAVYQAFRDRYPTLKSFSNAGAAELRTILAPLGLRWRAENFVDLAQTLRAKGWKQLPRTREELLGLPGVGEYVADAVLCFAFGKPAVLVDTNICRVVCRIRGLRLYPESRRNKTVRSAVRELAESNRCREYHYALIDFAERVCKPGKPQCEECPLRDRCNYYQTQVRSTTRYVGPVNHATT